jgi:hypothetical protein
LTIDFRRFAVGARAPVLALLFAVSACLSVPGVAAADQRYSSVVNNIRPATSGLQVTVLGSDSEMRLANRSGKDVAVVGYDGEELGRVLSDGSVQVNLTSPSYWLNQERMGGVNPPPSAKVGARPNWKTVNRTGVLIWHDHRMHWMGTGVPPAVKDQAKRTRVWNYKVPILVGGKPAAIDGTLWWVGQHEGAPIEAFIGLALIIFVVLGSALVVRRRRATEGLEE